MPDYIGVKYHAYTCDFLPFQDKNTSVNIHGVHRNMLMMEKNSLCPRTILAFLSYARLFLYIGESLIIRMKLFLFWDCCCIWCLIPVISLTLMDTPILSPRYYWKMVAAVGIFIVKVKGEIIYLSAVQVSLNLTGWLHHLKGLDPRSKPTSWHSYILEFVGLQLGIITSHSFDQSQGDLLTRAKKKKIYFSVD